MFYYEMPLIDIQILHEFFKSVTSASQSSPAGWTSLNPGSADSADKVALAALVNLGLFFEPSCISGFQKFLFHRY